MLYLFWTARGMTLAASPRARRDDAMANEKKRSGPDPRFVRFEEEEEEASGLGPESAGQAGDTMGLSRSEIEGPESVEELLEEGQSFEAGIISGVEDAPDADQGGVRTRQVPEDDVPQEYLDDEIPGRA
jgi:hypothetical protein